MIEGALRTDACVQESVYEPVIKIQSLGVDLSTSFGQDARPGNRNTITGDAQPFEDGDIFWYPIIVVTGTIGGVAVEYMAIPDTFPFSILIICSLYLICRSRGAPKKVARKFIGDLLFSCHEVSLGVKRRSGGISRD